MNVYTSKAEKYARYRWDYAPGAIQAIFEISQIGADYTVADVGAGTGILSRHFAGKVERLLAIEPDPAMRGLAQKTLGDLPGCSVIDACAEATMLPAHSVDLVCAAQASHWFDPAAARAEFLRILKPRGWMAFMRNASTNQAIDQALAEIFIPENGVTPDPESQYPEQKPIDFYFGNGHFQRLVFPFSYQQDWLSFIGALTTASYMPDETHPLYPKLESAALKVFERFCVQGKVEGRGQTELVLGVYA
jgi:ubiquinone/menaquinone biosynthesis C-methylase UbiE